MTREEAIIILQDCELNPCVPEDREAVDMAIDALKQESTVDKIIADVKELDGTHLIGDYENERWIEILIYPMV